MKIRDRKSATARAMGFVISAAVSMMLFASSDPLRTTCYGIATLRLTRSFFL